MKARSITVTRSITVAELDGLHWIRVRAAQLDFETSQEVRHACLRGLERGIAEIVIELTGVVRVCVDGVDMLEAAADELRAKHGTLSLVVQHDESVGRLDLRRVPAVGLSELAGLSAALDDALLEGGRLQPSMTAPTEGGSDAR